MAIPAVTTAALLSAPFFVLLLVFGYMATTTPSELCLEGCICYSDIQNNTLKTLNCTSFRPVLDAASSLLSDFSHIDVLNVQNVVDGSSDYMIDGLFGIFSNVRYMNLINSSMFKIGPNTFKGLKHLEELDISKNQIFKFHSETFKETPKLKVLDLSFNPLRLGPTTLLRSKSLEVLIVSSCNLSSIPTGSLRGLTNLKTLDLYNNRIQSFTVRSFPKNIKHLWLTRNNLTNVPTKELSLLKKLTSLDISKNPINCTCSLIGLQDWFSSKGILFENDVICRYPSFYRGKSWKKVSENEVCFESEKTNSITNKEECLENSCGNEINNDSREEDRYIYNVQADQAVSDIVTEDAGSTTTVFSTDQENGAISDLSEGKIFKTKTSEGIFHENFGENFIMNRSKNLFNISKTPSFDTNESTTVHSLISQIPNDTLTKSALSYLIDITTVSTTVKLMAPRTKIEGSTALPEETDIPSDFGNKNDVVIPTLNSPLHASTANCGSTSTSDITTMSTVGSLVIMTDNIASFGTIKCTFERNDSIIESTNSNKSGENKSIINALPMKETTVYAPYLNEETLGEIPSKVNTLKIRNEVYFDPTNKPEARFILARADYAKVKMVENNDCDKQKPENISSFVVLAGIIIVLFLLILCAVTKKCKNSSKKKMTFMQDSENNLSELHDMTKIFVSEDKNIKETTEELSAKTDLPQTEKLTCIQRDGYVNSKDVELDRTEEPAYYGVDEEPRCESQLTRSNSSTNRASPFEITKTKILGLHDSQPQTPTYPYMQEDVKS